ncbi:hypothetical protein J2W49_003292 [Hydrogenophaga palleronii]|uniref:DUF1579 domain-containing protein n=1 Tax=Hydrogenophaga palleronii TaxID=65655 RepID=A0ABU1WPT6_9BURK|nr:DUF1579 domain-containing protein [Hydrogenophaga palleronii]MDR7151316.1 hypothetical protein [Hydrogenophaga palleronii]
MDTSTENDFDFLQGRWRVHHKRLRERLVDCQEWQAFEGTCAMQPILDGKGNLDDNWLDLPDGGYRAISLRVFDASSRRWAIWWLDDRRPHALDVPVAGGFEHGTGTFYADDTLDGLPIRVRFRWTDTQSATPRWEQAFSIDGGATWEVNWIMQFTRETGGCA